MLLYGLALMVGGAGVLVGFQEELGLPALRPMARRLTALRRAVERSSAGRWAARQLPVVRRTGSRMAATLLGGVQLAAAHEASRREPAVGRPEPAGRRASAVGRREPAVGRPEPAVRANVRANVGAGRHGSGRANAGRAAVGRAAVPDALRPGAPGTAAAAGERTEVMRNPVTRLPARPRAIGRASPPPSCLLSPGAARLPPPARRTGRR